MKSSRDIFQSSLSHPFISRYNLVGLSCTNIDNKSCMLEWEMQQPKQDIIRTDGKIVHSHHAKPSDCLQHNPVCTTEAFLCPRQCKLRKCRIAGITIVMTFVPLTLLTRLKNTLVLNMWPWANGKKAFKVGDHPLEMSSH